MRAELAAKLGAQAADAAARGSDWEAARAGNAAELARQQAAAGAQVNAAAGAAARGCARLQRWLDARAKDGGPDDSASSPTPAAVPESAAASSDARGSSMDVASPERNHQAPAWAVGQRGAAQTAAAGLSGSGTGAGCQGEAQRREAEEVAETDTEMRGLRAEAVALADRLGEDRTAYGGALSAWQVRT